MCKFAFKAEADNTRTLSGCWRCTFFSFHNKSLTTKINEIVRIFLQFVLAAFSMESPDVSIIASHNTALTHNWILLHMVNPAKIFAIPWHFAVRSVLFFSLIMQTFFVGPHRDLFIHRSHFHSISFGYIIGITMLETSHTVTKLEPLDIFTRHDLFSWRMRSDGR